MTNAVYGLVLAGGRSSRMQRDKATLQYHGRTQLEWAVALLQPHVEKVFVSIRPDQQNDPARSQFATIVDRQDNLGPIAGINAAQQQHPHVAWLVLGCDLPFLDDATLTALVAARDPGRVATAYRSSRDGLPEPLCAIFEPSSRDAITAYIAGGKSCPRKFLIQSDVCLVNESNPHALDNINTPEEYGSAMSTISPARSDAVQVRVQYYALLREQAGRSEEAVTTRARTARELYQELKARYPFSLAPEMLRVAVNAEFSDWSQQLVDGDSVVFIPPVAGG